MTKLEQFRAKDKKLKADLKANNIEVIEVKYVGWDDRPQVEIAWKHRNELGELQDTVGDRLGVQFRVRV